MPVKKVVVALLTIVVAIGGFVAGLVLLRQRQELRQLASVPGGQAQVSITPETGSFNIGDTIRASVYFNPANIPISGVAVRLMYPFSGTTPEVRVSRIEINPTLLNSGEWTCPTQNTSLQGGNVIIDIACGNTSAYGFVANTNTLLASIDLSVERTPATNPLVIRFDPAQSVIIRKSDGEDILLIPTSTGTYTIGQGAVSPSLTPTPTTRVTSTPSPTPRLTLTPTPRRTATASATPTTTKGGLPDAGVSYPTLLGVGVGVLTIIGALLLAL